MSTTLKRIFTLEHAIHAVIILCAGTSLENIKDFFQSKGHPDQAAWLISLTLGSGVVITSIMLTRVDPLRSKTTFYWMFTSALSFALLSGGIQSAQYASHNVLFPWNILLGFSLPITGEVLLAWASSLYILHQKAIVLETIQEDAQSAVTKALVTSLEQFDSSQVRESVNALMLQLADQSLQSAGRRLLGGFPTEILTSRLNSPEPVVLGPVRPIDIPMEETEVVDPFTPERIADAIEKIVDNPGKAIAAVASVLGIEKIDPSKHCLVTRRNGDVYCIEKIDENGLTIYLQSQPSYRRDIKMSSISKYYDLKMLSDL